MLRILAATYSRKQRFTEARECLKLALENGDDFKRDIRLDLSLVYKDMNEHEKAIAELKTILDESPGDERCWVTMGDSYRKLGNHKRSMECYRESIRIHPDQYGYMGLGDCYQDLHKIPEALKWYEKAAALSPRDAASRLADAYQGAGRDEDARIWYRKAIEANPGMAPGILPKLDTRLAPPSPVGRPGQPAPSPSSEPLTPVQAWLESDIGKVISMCREAGVPLLMHSYPSGTLHGVLVDTAAKNNIPFVDHLPAFQALKDPASYFAPDLHCNDLGYGVMARDLQPKVIEMLSGCNKHH